jgi:hypothetical protein
MPASTPHPHYTARVDEWQRCRDVIAGGDAVKEGNETYLPRLSGQGLMRVEDPQGNVYWINEYQTYRDRANFYPATERTVEGMVGALMRKAPVFDVPESLRGHLDNLTQTGESAEAFTERLVTELISVGRHGILVEWPRGDEEQRPYWVHYRTEDILNWPDTMGRGRWVVQESVLEPTDDEFVDESITQWRVLDLDENGWYRQRVYRKSAERGETLILIETVEPTIRGQRLDYLPVVCAGLPDPEKPPILGLVDINLSHYRTSADLEEARHKLAVPTPWAAGFQLEPGQALRMGASVAHVSSEPNARMGMLEFSGSGLSELRLALQEKEAMMAAIGARLLEAPRAGIESAEAIRLRTSGEMNVLMNIAQAASEAMTRACRYHALWMRADPDACRVAINEDFVDQRLTPQEQAANLADYQAGVISYSTWHWRTSLAEMLPPDVTAEEEKAMIDAERPLSGEIIIPPDQPVEGPTNGGGPANA